MGCIPYPLWALRNTEVTRRVGFSQMIPGMASGKNICFTIMEKFLNSSQSLQPLQSLQGLQNVQSVQSVQSIQTALSTNTPASTLTPLDQWHDNFEVMEMFHISQRTLQTLRSNGKLPFAKMGGRCYYKESDLQRLLEESYRDSRIKPMPDSSAKGSTKENFKAKDEKGGTTCP